MTSVVDALHDAVVEAGLENPIVVGHSIGGPIASIYAATYEAAAVVSIEAPLRVEPFAQQLASRRDQLTGTGFAEAWAHYQASWRMDLVPQPQRELLRAGEHGSQDVVLSYQSDLLERSTRRGRRVAKRRAPSAARQGHALPEPPFQPGRPC